MTSPEIPDAAVEARTLAGETCMGMPVAFYVADTEHGGHEFASHWSTLPEFRKPERLFRESDIRAALPHLAAGRAEAVAADEPDPDVDGFRRHLIEKACDPSSGFTPIQRALYSLISLPRRAQSICTEAEREEVTQTVAKAIDAAVRSALVSAPSPSQEALREARGVDDLTRDEIDGLAKRIFLNAGWKASDKLHVPAVLGLMKEIAAQVLTNHPGTCDYPGCGCDEDAVCNAALAQSAPVKGGE